METFFGYLILALLLSPFIIPILIMFIGFAYGVAGSILGLLYRGK